MKLTQVNITNFRSIKSAKIEFDDTCRVLVGINESGKSNILRALSLLSSERKPSKIDDIREPLPNEDQDIKVSYIEYIFQFTKVELEEIHNDMKSVILSKKDGTQIVTLSGKGQSLKDFIQTRDTGLYTVNILKESKYAQYYILQDSYVIDGTKWQKPSSECPDGYMVDGKNLKDFKLVNIEDYPEIPKNYLSPATREDLGKFNGDYIAKKVKEELPYCIFWEYNENNILPNEVDYNGFCEDPSICEPLKSMFLLAGVINIKESVKSAEARGSNKFNSYLQNIAEKTTDYFREVWKEYKNIEFTLRLDGSKIIPGIKEKNTLDFSKRSDGFKRFVTFLLIIGTNVRTGNIINTLILIDEPEISLHPSGARYLRDELIKIGKKNIVVYSTHSIFMIDTGNIPRHYIVKKEDEITKVEPALDDNIKDEEVLLNSLGFSAFNILNKNIILFEGWKDKKLFLTYLQGTAVKTIKSKYKKGYDFTHARGVGSIKAITPLLTIGDRNCTIVSDNDNPAKEEKKEYEKAKLDGTWKTYSDIDTSTIAVTGEDFVKNDFITQNLNKICKKLSLSKFNEGDLPATDKISYIKAELRKKGLNDVQIKVTINEIKDSIFEDISYKNIEDSYRKIAEEI